MTGTAETVGTTSMSEGRIEVEDFEASDDVEDLGDVDDIGDSAKDGDLDGPDVNDNRIPETPVIPTPVTGSPAVRAIPAPVATGTVQSSNGIAEVILSAPGSQSLAGTTDAAVVEDVEGVDNTDNGFALIEAPAVSAALAASSTSSATITTSAASSTDSPEPISLSQSESEL